MRVHNVGGVRIPFTEAEELEADAKEKLHLENMQATKWKTDRQAQYLPLEEQLDMLGKDLLDGGTRLKDHRAKVKSDNPKP